MRATLLAVALLFPAFGAGAAPSCPAAGAWFDPATGRQPPWTEVAADLARARVVLLGETHDRADHHLWQSHVLAALLGRRDDLVIGLEMIPRRLQPALDRWVAGDLDETAFVREIDWDRVWGFDFRLYRPVFEFARLNRVPLVALNVDRSLVARVRREGWAAVPPADREGVGDPAPASAAYRAVLADILRQHPADGTAAAPAAPAATDQDRFVAAQLVWDRAMAEALAARVQGSAPPLAVAIVGSGHIEGRLGIPHQLADLGVGEGVEVLLPLAPSEPCPELTAATADLVFGITSQDSPAAAPRPRLGVQIRDGQGGVAVTAVTPGSVAAAADLRAGDVIETAAGVPVAATRELVAIIQRQAPGTWLPLAVRREGTALELVARFPAQP